MSARLLPLLPPRLIGPACEIAAVTAAVVLAVVPIPRGTVEAWFSIRAFPAIQRVITPLSNSLPIALFDVLCVAAAAAVVAAVVHAVRQVRRTRRAAPAVRMAAHLVAGAAVVYIVFLVLWGFNYRRISMSDRVALEADAPTPEAVVRLGREAASRLNALHDDAHRVGWADSPLNHASLRRGFAEIQRALSDAPLAEPGRLKRSMFGPYFRWTSVDGMINPFGLEVLVNSDLLPFERPFVATHEWAHLAGYADESEASFVGWLACLRADPPAQYSGWLALYWQVNGEVNAEERRQLADALAPGPRRDVDAIIARIERGAWPWLRDAGWRVYDRYLKANRVEEGVRSYGAVVTLILRARFDEDRMPVRRAPASDDPRGS